MIECKDQKWADDATTYRDKLYCGRHSVWINPTGHTCELCKAGRWPGRARSRRDYRDCAPCAEKMGRAVAKASTPRPPTLGAPPYDRRVGVIIPARNERLLSPTVANVLNSFHNDIEARVVVIDDASDKHVPEKVAAPPRVIVHRHDRPRGEAVCRNRGYELLGDWPDACVTLDAHMEVRSDRCLEMLASAAVATGGVVCGTTFNLAPHKRDFPRNGGRLTWAAGGKDAGLRVNWSYTRERVLQPVAAPYGASYAMTPDTWRRLGGWTDRAAPYGYGEQALALRAWFLGVPIFCHTQAHIAHYFRKPRPYPMSGKYYWRNYVYCNRLIFSEAVFQRVFWPVAKRAMARDARTRELAKRPRLIPKGDDFIQRKRRTDAECLEWLGVA